MTGKTMHSRTRRSCTGQCRAVFGLSVALCLLCLAAWPLHAVGAVEGHAVDWFVIDSCGVADTSPSYRLHAAVGQPAAGTCDGTSHEVGIGYLGKVAAEEPLTDISLVKTVNNADPIEGATITYTLTCWNNGPSDSTGIQVTDQLPAGVAYFSHLAPGSIYDPVSGVWDLGAVTASGFLRLYITATVDGGTTGQAITNTAAVTASDQTDPNPGNETDDAVITVGFGVHYVDPNGSHVSPFVNWATAATNIQDAVDVAANGSVVRVADGVYTLGGHALDEYTLTNRVYITRDILVQSVNGPEHTHIVGAAGPGGTNGPGAQRCAYLSGNARLEGFTLRDGHTYNYDPESENEDPYGGGLYLAGGGTVSNCVIRDCSSYESGGGVYANNGGELIDCLIISNRSLLGGGVYFASDGWAYRCRILDNVADGEGGGVATDGGGSLDTCLIAGNTAVGGGGVSMSWGGTLDWCTLGGNHAGGAGGGVYATDECYLWATILYGNTAGTSDTNWYIDGAASFDFCSTMPDPGGASNVVDHALFVNAAAGDYRLQGGSPCIDACEPGFDPETDLNLVPRPLDGDNNGTTISDIGAYEYAHENADTDGDGMGDGFEVRYGLDVKYAGDAVGNLDGDPHSNLQEAIADTDPTDSNAYLRITGVLKQPGGVDVQWQGGVHARQYLETRPALDAGDWVAIQTNEPPTPVTTDFADPAGASENHYRIKAERP